jgi:murein DD-endopeptidase MepM/ murein hydrolase activator NlpD
MLPPGRWAGLRAIAVFALGACLLLPVSHGWSPAHADPGIDEKVEEAGEAVAEANKAVKKALATLRETETKLPLAREQRRDAAARAAEAKAQAMAAKRASQQARADLAATQASMEQVNKRLSSAADLVDDLARTSYQQGPLREIEVLLSAASPQDFAIRLLAVDRVARAQEEAQRELFATKALLAEQEVQVGILAKAAQDREAEAVAQLSEAKRASAQATAAAVQVSDLAKKRAKALRKAKSNRVAVSLRYAQLKKTQKRLKRQAKQAARRAAQGSDGSDSGEDGMVWPISGGNISDEPGPRTHPVYGYRSCHTGIDIAVPSGTNIKAARSGTVAEITRGGPYGLATLVAHGGGMTTFYAHQSSVRVKEGDRVDAGDVIGEVGSTGWSTGPHLHFEIHLDGDAYDPRGWYGRGKDRIGCQ